MSSWGLIGGLGKGMSEVGEKLFDDEMSQRKEARLNAIRQRERSEDRANAVADRDYAANQAAEQARLQYEHQLKMQGNDHNFTGEQNDLGRQLSKELQDDKQDHDSSENNKNRIHQADLARLGREHESSENKKNQDFRERLQQSDQEFREGLQSKENEFRLALQNDEQAHESKMALLETIGDASGKGDGSVFGKGNPGVVLEAADEAIRGAQNRLDDLLAVDEDEQDPVAIAEARRFVEYTESLKRSAILAFGDRLGADRGLLGGAMEQGNTPVNAPPAQTNTPPAGKAAAPAAAIEALQKDYDGLKDQFLEKFGYLPPKN